MIARLDSVVQRLEFYHTPVHGAWQNMAEMETGIFARGCLSQPLEGLVDLRKRSASDRKHVNTRSHRSTLALASSRAQTRLVASEVDGSKR
jgi:hypothetical protein